MRIFGEGTGNRRVGIELAVFVELGACSEDSGFSSVSSEAKGRTIKTYSSYTSISRKWR